MLTVVGGGLLLFGAAQHLLAKTMSLFVGVALAAAAIIALASGDVLGLAAANGWTELAWGVAAAILLFNTVIPRRRTTVATGYAGGVGRGQGTPVGPAAEAGAAGGGAAGAAERDRGADRDAHADRIRTRGGTSSGRANRAPRIPRPRESAATPSARLKPPLADERHGQSFVRPSGLVRACGHLTDRPCANQQRTGRADQLGQMRRLIAHQAVEIHLDAKAGGWEGDWIECRVGSVLGPVATLTALDGIAPELRETLTPGSLGFMTFQYQRAPIALRGVALAVSESEDLEFVVIDGIQMAERRTAARMALLTPVRAACLDAAGVVTAAVATVTANLSMGGALLTRRPGLGNGPRWQIELCLPGDPLPVRCDAVLVRETPTHAGVKFVDMQEADQLRLAGILAEHQRRA